MNSSKSALMQVVLILPLVIFLTIGLLDVGYQDYFTYQAIYESRIDLYMALPKYEPLSYTYILAFSVLGFEFHTFYIIYIVVILFLILYRFYHLSYSFGLMLAVIFILMFVGPSMSLIRSNLAVAVFIYMNNCDYFLKDKIHGITISQTFHISSLFNYIIFFTRKSVVIFLCVSLLVLFLLYDIDPSALIGRLRLFINSDGYFPTLLSKIFSSLKLVFLYFVLFISVSKHNYKLIRLGIMVLVAICLIFTFPGVGGRILIFVYANLFLALSIYNINIVRFSFTFWPWLYLSLFL